MASVYKKLKTKIDPALDVSDKSPSALWEEAMGMGMTGTDVILYLTLAIQPQIRKLQGEQRERKIGGDKIFHDEPLHRTTTIHHL